MVVSESTGSSFWHKCTIGADRGGEIFDMLSRRGVGPVVPVPESAVDQFSGLSGARPQSGFAGKASVLRMPLSSCPGLWPPSAASSGLMHSHQHLLFGGVLEGGAATGNLGSTRAACRAGLVFLPGHTKKTPPTEATHPHGHSRASSRRRRYQWGFGASIEGLEREAVIGKREGGGLGFQKMAIVMSRTSD